jgi:fucose permease
MARREPLRQADLMLLSGYGFFLFLVVLWLLAAGMAFQQPPGEFPVVDWLVRHGPPYLVMAQGLFFLAAAQFKAFRQRLMASEARAQEALTGALVLFGAALLFRPFLLD